MSISIELSESQKIGLLAELRGVIADLDALLVALTIEANKPHASAHLATLIRDRTIERDAALSARAQFFKETRYREGL